jgi:hypothetical protein
MNKLKNFLKIVLWILIFIVFTTIGATFLLLHSGSWSSRVSKIISNLVEQNTDLTLSSLDLDGNIFRYLIFKNLIISTESEKELLFVGNLRVDYNLISFIRRKPKINEIAIDDLRFTIPESIDSLKKLLSSNGNGGHLEINNISVTNLECVESENNDELIFSSELLRGKLFAVNDTTYIYSDTARFLLHKLGEKFELTDLDLAIAGNTIRLNVQNISNCSSSGKINGELELVSKETKSSLPVTGVLNFDFKNLVFAQQLDEQEKIFLINDFLNISGSVSFTKDSINSSLRFDGRFRSRDISGGKIVASFQNKKINIESISFSSEGEKIVGNAKGEIDSNLYVNLNLANFNINEWGIAEINTNLCGSIFLELYGKFARPEKIITKLALDGSKIDTLAFKNIEGEFVYENGLITVTDTLLVDLGKAQVQFAGNGNIETQDVDILSYVDVVDIAQFKPLVNSDIKGKVTGIIELKGNIKNPNLTGKLVGDDIETSQFHISETIVRFDVIGLGEQNFNGMPKGGNVFIEANNCKISSIGDLVSDASLSASFTKDTIYVKSLKLVGKEANVELKGNVIDLKDFCISDLNFLYNENVLRNLEPIFFSIGTDTIKLKETNFTLNNSIVKISGSVSDQTLISGSLDFADVSIEPINSFLEEHGKVSGILNGYIEYKNINNSPIVKSKLSLKDANLFGFEFKNIDIKPELKRNFIHINKLAITDTNSGNIQGSGYLGCNFQSEENKPFVSATDTLNLYLKFSNISLNSLTPILPGNIAIGGKLSGDISLNNCAGSPVINYNLNIVEPAFDKLYGNELIVRGSYRDSKVFLDEVLLQEEGGLYKGYGYLPFNISISPPKAVFEEDSLMNINISANTTTLPFLTNYIKGIEDISGKFDIALKLSDTPNDPVRSGNINVKNGFLDISAIENSFTNINGSAILDNDTLDIISASCFLVEPLEKSLWRNATNVFGSTIQRLFRSSPKIMNEPNLTVTGIIDFTEFLNPGYNLTFSGEDIYFRTLLAEQEGFFDIDITISGRDSLEISGDVNVENLFLRNEFVKLEKAIEEDEQDKKYVSIDLHVFIPGNLYLQNSQLDCELEGELWVTKEGHDPVCLSGNLNVKEGNFYYFGWEFVIERGAILFDPVEFNPTLDIEAKVNLASYIYQSDLDASDGSEWITVRLTGDLEKPDLQFESDKYTQTDILQFLTRTRGGIDEILDQDRLSSQALNVFGQFFERQVERQVNRIIGLDKFDIRTNGNLATVRPDELSIILGQRISSNMFLTYESNLSIADPCIQVGLEYRLDRNVSIINEVDQDGLINIKYRFKHRY